jgi:hypothetical protein
VFATTDPQRSVSLEIIAWEAYIIVVYLCWEKTYAQ